MKNKDAFENPAEMQNAYKSFCSSNSCGSCKANGTEELVDCYFTWMFLEHEPAPSKCPFCGSTCAVNEEYGFYVKCTSRDCAYRSGYAHTRDLAVKNHNRIAQFDSPSE